MKPALLLTLFVFGCSQPFVNTEKNPPPEPRRPEPSQQGFFETVFALFLLWRQ